MLCLPGQEASGWVCLDVLQGLNDGNLPLVEYSIQLQINNLSTYYVILIISDYWILSLIYFALSVTMKLANTPPVVWTFGWLVMLREGQFVQTILAAMGVLYERFSPQFHIINNFSRYIYHITKEFMGVICAFSHQYTEADLYKQLTYFCHLLDTQRGIEKVNFIFLKCFAIFCLFSILFNTMALCIDLFSFVIGRRRWRLVLKYH